MAKKKKQTTTKTNTDSKSETTRDKSEQVDGRATEQETSASPKKSGTARAKPARRRRPRGTSRAVKTDEVPAVAGSDRSATSGNTAATAKVEQAGNSKRGGDGAGTDESTTRPRRRSRRKPRSSSVAGGDGQGTPSAKSSSALAQPAGTFTKQKPQNKLPTQVLEETAFGAGLEPSLEEKNASAEIEKPAAKRSRRRRGPRRRPKTADDAGTGQTSESSDETQIAVEPEVAAPAKDEVAQEPGATSGRRRRRSRSRRKSKQKTDESQEQVTASAEKPVDETMEEDEAKAGESAVSVKSAKQFPTAGPIDRHERVMLINVADGEECRIAIIHENRLEELFMERASDRSNVGNIYKGRVTNVEPSIQAAFVDFGLAKNGFLHISDLQPQYFPDGQRHAEDVGRKTPRRDRPPIQKCLRRGQEVIVQIIKEGIGTKGPTLTSYISIPGRYLVMMPGMSRLGVSRRIEDEDERRKLRRSLEELNLPKDMGLSLIHI